MSAQTEEWDNVLLQLLALSFALAAVVFILPDPAIVANAIDEALAPDVCSVGSSFCASINPCLTTVYGIDGMGSGLDYVVTGCDRGKSGSFTCECYSEHDDPERQSFEVFRGYVCADDGVDNRTCELRRRYGE
jgi:hypothetical protein